ncbi:MAG TPA: glycosyltransferase [Halococcus sp.]|nr:glycosyltransferase [Halococcus sp.]
MASVLLPTHRWTPSCAALARQLDPGDELLVLCDHQTDPVATDPPTAPPNTTIEIVPVGDPEHCSGKANALAAGLERANDDLLVFTDDDVERDDEWLSRLKRLAHQHGAASVTPAFVSSSVQWRLAEPVMMGLGSALLCRYGGVWGGGVAFERDQLDEETFRSDLRRTVSDDALLWSMLDTVHTTPAFVSRVRVPGGRKQVRDRVTRFVLTYRYFLPRAVVGLWVLLTMLLAITALRPLVSVIGITALAALGYRYLGIDRRTWLLAFPAFLLLPFVLVSVWFRPRFDWGGRHYVWRERFDVTVTEYE